MKWLRRKFNAPVVVPLWFAFLPVSLITIYIAIKLGAAILPMLK